MSTNIQFGGDISTNTAAMIKWLQEYGGAAKVPLAKGTGWDSIVLDATPDPDYPETDRTNTAAGNFSIVFGSRNDSKADESFIIGGNNKIYKGAGDGFAFGYNNVLGDSQDESFNTENSAVGGTNNAVKARYSFGHGSGNLIDNGHSVAAFGYHNTIYNGRGNFVSGANNKIGQSGGNYKDENKSYNACFGNENILEAQGGIVSGAGNHVVNNNVAVFGYGNTTSRANQLICGLYSAASDDELIVVGCGSESEHANCFAAGKNDSNGSFIRIGSTTMTEAQLTALIGMIPT